MGRADGDLTGRDANRTIAVGKVTSADFATSAKAPDAAKLGGAVGAACPQAFAHGCNGLRKDQRPLELASLPGVGTLSLSCDSSGNAAHTDVSHAAAGGELALAVERSERAPANILRAYDLTPGQSTTRVVDAGTDQHVTSLVTSRPGAPSGEFDVITDGVNNDCHEQMTTLLIPTTTQ
jgi:hypothetical protein